jgi:hypothetical protein
LFSRLSCNDSEIIETTSNDRLIMTAQWHIFEHRPHSTSLAMEPGTSRLDADDEAFLVWYCSYVIQTVDQCRRTASYPLSREPVTRVTITRIINTYLHVGHAMAQAVSRRCPTAAAARVRAQVRSCGTCDGQKWHWGRFSPSTSVSPANSHSTDCSTSIIYHPGLVQ